MTQVDKDKDDTIQVHGEGIALDDPTRPRLLTYLVQIPSLIWDFTESNFITFVLPNTAFGVLGAMAGPELLAEYVTEAGTISNAIIWVRRGLLAMVFNWTNVIIFDLQNQTAPQSLEEDRANKPWRPIPSGRITEQQARKSMFVAIPACLALNRALGVEREGLYIQIGSYVYNDLRGGDSVARDFLIAIAFALFNTASLRIASAGNDVLVQLSPAGRTWVGLISLVILTTMQVQDLKDQAGDRLRNRWTVPLVLGERTSRISLALLIPFWTGFCAWVWWPRGHWAVILPPVLVGALCTVRVLVKRTPKADSNTWKLWCLWGVGLYYLPFASTLV